MNVAAAPSLTRSHSEPARLRRGRRKWFFLLALVLLLAALVGLSRLTSNWHYILSGKPGEVLYAATFDDLLADWDQYQGRLEAQAAGGVMRIRAETTSAGPFSVMRSHFCDFDYRVQARAVDGPLNNGFGVIFRLQNKGNHSLSDDSYYLFLVSSDGYYQVRRVVDGESKELSAWIPSQAVNQGIGALNTLRVVGIKDQFRFYINGTPAHVCVPDDADGSSTYDDISGTCVGGQMTDVLTDASIRTGQLGVVVTTLDEPNVTVEFDNVLVMMPED